MAQFTNQAQLSYNNTVVNSNIAVGEILEIITVTKTPVTDTYRVGDTLTYVVGILNSGSSSVTGISVEDDLGAYDFGGTSLYPLTYVEGSVKLFVNGAPAAAPTVTAGPPLVFSGITIPADSDAIIVYQATVNEYAPVGETDSIVNTVTVTGAGISESATAEATVTPVSGPSLTVTKSITPVPVTENDLVTYTFAIANYGNAEATADYDATLTDTFDPVLTGVSVQYNGGAWVEGTNFNYDETTGQFATVAGQITVPAATYTQDPATGIWSVTPGISTLVVTGTI